MAKKNKKKKKSNRYHHIVQAQQKVQHTIAPHDVVVHTTAAKADVTEEYLLRSRHLKQDIVKVGGFSLFVLVVYAILYYLISSTPYLSFLYTWL